MRFLLDGGVPPLANVVIPGKGPMPLIDVAESLAYSAITWEDLRWIKDVWRGPVILKGVLTGEDARRAVDAGAAAIVVSNHGGRQLDGVQATLRALPEIVSAVEWPNRSADGRRDSPRRGHREGHLPGSSRRPLWTSVRLWLSGGR